MILCRNGPCLCVERCHTVNSVTACAYCSISVFKSLPSFLLWNLLLWFYYLTWQQRDLLEKKLGITSLSMCFSSKSQILKLLEFMWWYLKHWESEIASTPRRFSQGLEKRIKEEVSFGKMHARKGFWFLGWAICSKHATVIFGSYTSDPQCLPQML